MHWSFILVAILFSIIQSHAYAAACDTSDTATATGAAFNTNCTVTDGTTGTVIQLNFYNGFSDATSISAIDGNNGTTVGAQRKLSFIKAAELIAAQVDTPQTLIVDADFTSLSCDAGSATLGSAGATTNMGNVTPAAGITNTFYPIGLLNAIGNYDYASSDSDITAQFNAYIGTTGCLQASSGWYYGFGTPTSGYIGFTTVLLHEITHGLGFASLTDASTGAKASGIDDIFSNFLYSLADGADWSVGAGLSNGQRAASAVSSTGLLWNGSNVNTQAIGLLTAGFEDTGSDSGGTFNSGDKVQMYAPNPVESGSSVSHFNTVVAPNELMEPQYTEGQYTLGLAAYLLKDIGWTMVLSSNNAPTITASDQTTNEDTAKVIDASGWATDADSDTLTYSVASSCATSITCSINSDGTNFTMTPAANHNGGTHTITINVSDGNGGTDSDTFNLSVTAVNDAPAISGLPDITSLAEGTTSSAVDLDTYTTDVDGDTSFTYTDTACGTHLTCNISGSSLTITAGTGFTGTESVTIQAQDAGGLSNTDTFNVTITASVANTAPVLNSIGNQAAPISVDVNVSLSATDSEGDTLSYSITSDVSSVASISGSTLTLNSASIGSFSVTIQVSDGNGGTDSETITFTTYAEPSIEINNSTLVDGDALNINNSSSSIDLSSLGSSYSYNLTFEGANADSLLSASGNTLSLAMPQSGQFAGEYVLTFTDSHTGATYDVTLIRSPRLVLSATKLLENLAIQTLIIEGAAAGTSFTLSSSETNLSFVVNENVDTTAVAENNASSFNKAEAILSVGNVSASTSVTITVDSIFETVQSSGVSLEPSREHIVTVEDSSGSALSGATFTLDTSTLSGYNLESEYVSNTNGVISLVLPGNTTAYSASISLTGYNNASVTLASDIFTQIVTMEQILNPMRLIGEINATNGLSFASELPEVIITLDDGSEVTLTVTRTSNSLAEFDYIHNLSNGSVTQLSVSHSDAVGVIFNINTSNNVNFDIFLSSSTQTITNEDTDVGSSAGSLGGFISLLMLSLLVQRKRRFK